MTGHLSPSMLLLPLTPYQKEDQIIPRAMKKTTSLEQVESPAPSSCCSMDLIGRPSGNPGESSSPLMATGRKEAHLLGITVAATGTCYHNSVPLSTRTLPWGTISPGGPHRVPSILGTCVFCSLAPALEDCLALCNNLPYLNE